jgi:hypothetical protein
MLQGLQPLDFEPKVCCIGLPLGLGHAQLLVEGGLGGVVLEPLVLVSGMGVRRIALPHRVHMLELRLVRLRGLLLFARQPIDLTVQLEPRELQRATRTAQLGA